MIIDDEGNVKTEPLDNLYAVKVGDYLLMTDDIDDNSTCLGFTMNDLRTKPERWQSMISWILDHPKHKNSNFNVTFGAAIVTLSAYNPLKGVYKRYSLNSAKKLFE